MRVSRRGLLGAGLGVAVAAPHIRVEAAAVPSVPVPSVLEERFEFDIERDRLPLVWLAGSFFPDRTTPPGDVLRVEPARDGASLRVCWGHRWLQCAPLVVVGTLADHLGVLRSLLSAPLMTQRPAAWHWLTPPDDTAREATAVAWGGVVRAGQGPTTEEPFDVSRHHVVAIVGGLYANWRGIHKWRTGRGVDTPGSTGLAARTDCAQLHYPDPWSTHTLSLSAGAWVGTIAQHVAAQERQLRHLVDWLFGRRNLAFHAQSEVDTMRRFYDRWYPGAGPVFIPPRPLEG